MQRLGSISSSIFIVCGALGWLGCGDNRASDLPDAGTSDAATPDAATPDAALPDAALPDAATPDAAMPDAAMPDAATPDAPASPTAYAVAGDFAATGIFTSIDVAAATVQPNALTGVAGGDPVLRRIGDELFIVNRDQGDSVTVLGGATLAVVGQYATGAGSNPQDVAQVGTKLYLPGLGTAGVVVIDRRGGAPTTIAIPGDPDDRPDCVSAFAVGTQVVVACGLLDGRSMARGNAQISIIDTATDTVTASFTLASPNPQGQLTETPTASTFGGDLLIATMPAFNDFSAGCLARVSLGTTPAANGCVATNLALGGNANHVSVAPDGATAWVAVTGYAPDYSSSFGRLHSIDLATGVVSAAVSPTTQQVDDVTACRDGYVVTSDGRFGSSGVRIWHDGVETTTVALAIGRATGFGNNLACF